MLVTGESGTGKELIAKAIHYHSIREIRSVCGRQLLGPGRVSAGKRAFRHEKGAFTDAYTTRKGRFELAHQGTLFLDEIGEMPMSLQAKLLRVLQEREFERVGGSVTIKVDVRMGGRLHRDLKQEVAQGRFREDLYYRLNVVHIHVPPLGTGRMTSRC